ncbi:MAG: helix-turn-helix domain-containing protein [Chloroflexi bacterium]|nr:helix-turn-helix domain-containing protein [Chloroflexota bacterium]MBI4269421.1 helix-turn-helix domain-containing protein [Candidatus Rokubacteria bacterium]
MTRDRPRRGRRARSAFKYAFEPKAFYTPSEVATILQVSSQTVLDWIHKDLLDAIQLSERVYRVPLGALMIRLGEPPRVRREVRDHLSGDAAADERALVREHKTSQGPR